MIPTFLRTIRNRWLFILATVVSVSIIGIAVIYFVSSYSVKPSRILPSNLPNDVLAQTKSQLPRFIDSMEIGQSSPCAFSTVAEKTSYTLGTPFAEYYYAPPEQKVSTDMLKAEVTKDGPSSWLVPIVVNEKGVCTARIVNDTAGKIVVQGVGFFHADLLPDIYQALAKNGQAGEFNGTVLIMGAGSSGVVFGQDPTGQIVWMKLLTEQNKIQIISPDEAAQIFYDFHDFKGGLLP